MFELLRFHVNPTDRKVECKIQHEWKGNTVVCIEKTFNDDVVARRWVNEQRKKYAYAKLKAFIDHKKIISDLSKEWSNSENRASKLKSLSICVREIDAIKDEPLWNLAKLIEVMYADLTNILPLPSHNTFRSSRVVLQDLWVFSQEVLKPKLDETKN